VLVYAVISAGHELRNYPTNVLTPAGPVAGPTSKEKVEPDCNSSSMPVVALNRAIAKAAVRGPQVTN